MRRNRASIAGLALVAAGALAACGTAPTGTAPVSSAPTGPVPASASPGPASGTPTSTPSVPASQAVPSSPNATSTAAPTATTGPTTTPASGCARLAASLSLTERVGQLVMVGIPSSGASADVRAILRRTRAGSVLLLQNSTAGVQTIARVTEAARSAAGAPTGTTTLLAADQEGGQVQRLRGSGFTRMPSASQQAGDSDRRLRTEAKTWGDQLAEAGIDANLAPVADVVPNDLRRVNQPIGQLDRGYGSDPAVVADKVTAFTRGMADAGMLTAVKHFPGLGRVRGNTDFVSRVVDPTTTRHDEDLAGFAAAVGAGVDMVMVSSATYSRIDPDRRAAFSPVVIGGMIRGDLDFDGVVISDDLAAAAMRDLSPSRRAVAFLEAGGDLAIVGDPSIAEAMTAAVIAEARTDKAFAARVSQSATRVLTMKAAHGLADCS